MRRVKAAGTGGRKNTGRGRKLESGGQAAGEEDVQAVVIKGGVASVG